LCHVLEVYFWIAISGLEGIGVKRGIDKNFPQVASASLDPSASLGISAAGLKRPLNVSTKSQQLNCPTQAKIGLEWATRIGLPHTNS
jgi:hypothetical protein